MPGFVLFVFYVIIALAPLGLSWVAGFPRRPLMDELSSALAMTAFAVLLLDFALSGRFRLMSGRIGIDHTMRWHQLFGRVVLVLVIAHPFLYTLPIPVVAPAWDPSAAEYLRLDGLGLITGALGWVLLITLILSAIWRDALPLSYEAWRLTHGLGAALVAGLTALHAFEAGRYSGTQTLTWFWAALLGLAALTLVYVYLLSPLMQLRDPFRVTSVKRIAERTWELNIARRDGRPLSFRPGQFVWLSLARHPLTLRENPFSIASDPGRDELSFVIKEVGDFTKSLGQVTPDQAAWIDGPHGALVLPDMQEAPGIGLIAGGVGIAPLLSIWRHMAATNDPRPSVLLYGNRAESQIVYPDELERLAARPGNSLTHVLQEPDPGWNGEVGFVGPASIAAAFDVCEGSENWVYLLCGPPAMVHAAETALRARGVPPANIHSEKFVYD
ncbi:ferredoxin reductase family protein [Aestuariivita boseongensis]|uniref:ferredoxin reductase family protein n=1 Tax=Aestuariivita boseongensis TaxID=1470562 RepID=UPI0006835C0A|nr:ferredoxin reductase family protein [Aestuariivita boseongensis]